MEYIELKQEYGYRNEKSICPKCKNFNPNTPYNKLYHKNCDKDLPGYSPAIISCTGFE